MIETLKRNKILVFSSSRFLCSPWDLGDTSSRQPSSLSRIMRVSVLSRYLRRWRYVWVSIPAGLISFRGHEKKQTAHNHKYHVSSRLRNSSNPSSQTKPNAMASLAGKRVTDSNAFLALHLSLIFGRRSQSPAQRAALAWPQQSS